MARKVGPDQSERVFFYTSGTRKGTIVPAGTPVPLYADPQVSLPADVLGLDGSPIAGTIPTVLIGDTLEAPEFLFPDVEDPVVYTRILGGPVVALHPDRDAVTDELRDRITAVESGVGGAETPVGAQTKADAAQAAAISAAAIDATSKANAAQAAATSAAATDATNKVVAEATARANADATKVGKGEIVLRPEDAPYGASGLGVADDWTAIKACFDAANALKKQAGTYYEPGATVLLRGKYNLAGMNAPIDVMCNVVTEGAIFTTPAGYTGTAVRVGHTTAGSTMQNMTADLPSVFGPSVAGVGSLPPGSVGVLVRNVYSSDIRVGKIAYYETALRLGGEGWGVAYNEIRFRTLTFTKVAVALKNLDAGGWANQNTFISGSVTGSIAWAGRRGSGVRGVVFDATGSTSVNGNTFVGVSFESDHYEHVFEFIGAYQNQFYGCRHEQGIAAAAVTVSGDTITSAAHVLAVGDMVMFTGTSAPTGMSFDMPYFVTEATVNTFKVAASRGGTAIAFTSSGTSVAYSRPHRVRYDNSSDNVIELPMTPVRWLDRVYGSGTTAALAGNIVRYPQQTAVDGYMPPTWPLSRVRNRFVVGTNVRPPLDAYYPATADPVTAPDSWTFGSSAVGPVWPGGQCVLSGAGSPEGAVIAPQGAIYLQTDSDGTVVLWEKKNGTSNTGWVANIDSGDLLAAGEIVPSRDLVTSAAVSHSSGTTALNFFTARRTETINTLTAYTGNTAAAATPTLIRYGVWSIDAAGAGTLIASTPNDTTLLAATNTDYPKALSAPWAKVAGRRYAVGVLVVSAATMPSYIGQQYVGTVTSLAFLGQAPRQTGRLTGQSDLAGFSDASLTVSLAKTAIKMS